MKLFLYARRPLHTSNPLLDVYFACRTARPSSPGLMVTLLRAVMHGCRGFRRVHHARNA